MSTYAAPLQDMQFVITELAGLDSITATPGCEEVTGELVEAVFSEAAKFAAEVLDPLNRIARSRASAARSFRRKTISSSASASSISSFILCTGWLK